MWRKGCHTLGLLWWQSDQVEVRMSHVARSITLRKRARATQPDLPSTSRHYCRTEASMTWLSDAILPDRLIKLVTAFAGPTLRVRVIASTAQVFDEWGVQSAMCCLTIL